MTPDSKLAAVAAAASGTVAAAVVIGTPAQWLWVLAGAAAGAAMATSLHDGQRTVLASLWAYVVDMLFGLAFAFVALPRAHAFLAGDGGEALLETEHVLVAVAAVLAAFGRIALKLAKAFLLSWGRAKVEAVKERLTKPGDLQ